MAKQWMFGFFYKFLYLCYGYLKQGNSVQATENEPLPSRYLLSYINDVTTR